jgi:hypothetical protein
MLIWSGFVICVLAQIIVLTVIKVQFRSLLKGVTPSEEVWFMFIPCMVFGLLCDVEILVQTFRYKPTAFKHTITYCKQLLLVVGFASLVMSTVLIVFSFLAFTPVITPSFFLQWFFICLIMKAVCWSPFIAIEMYDTVFENIYIDVNFQLNPIKPKKAPKLVTIRIDDSSDDYGLETN